MNIQNKYIGVILFSTLICACKEEFLFQPAVGEVDEALLTNKRGLEDLLIGAYSLLDGIGNTKSGPYSAGSNWLFGSVFGNEAYLGSIQADFDLSLLQYSYTASNFSFASKWATVYDGVQRANEVLRIMNKTKNLSEQDRKRISAEARVLRAHYHFEAKKIWNKVPYVNESITYANENYRMTNDKDIWADIENDLKYGIENLSIIPYQNAAGRVHKYTAMALLAKAYLFQKKYAAAKPLLESIISSGRYQLVKFHDNFNAETKNNKESIFAAQNSVNDGANGDNGNKGDMYNFPSSSLGPGTCCGYFQPSQYLVNHFKTNAITGLPDLDHFNQTDIK
ncbi:MAG TPA: RagB/SusD family nutrient uptake outer membrane protein, partial [Chitinophagaceae bacterium]|nr:RagB/SusD family nutrient uptake outer membrane protein [Chitinophagaceae bacterium]